MPALAWLLALGATDGRTSSSDNLVTLSLVGTTDLHGQIFPVDGNGGLALLGGYLKNLRAARASDGGAVLLFDSGDTYLDGMESNLSEGAIVIDAYNALGYTAAALGNHDFDFGAVDDKRSELGADRRGALKARAQQARFPFLAANMSEHGQPIDWPNVRRSVLVDAAGVKVGVIGAMTLYALSMTLPSNVTDLEVTPLAAAVEEEARRLRAEGAAIVVVATHAGGHCTAFALPTDLASCDEGSEIFEVAKALPRGLVDVIFAGHTHSALAHEVNGVMIVQAYSWGRAFSRVDVTVSLGAAGDAERTATRVQSVRVFPPREVCGHEGRQGRCAKPDEAGAQPQYEGRPVVPDAAIDSAMAPALAWVRALQATPLGPMLETTFRRGTGTEESPLANLFADAMHDVVPGTDAAIGHSSGPGGLRTDLPAGAATLGALYETFPFDNLVVRRTLTGRQLRRILTTQLRRPRWGGRTLGVSGLRVTLDCVADGYDVELERGNGTPIGNDDVLVVAMTDYLAARSAEIAPAAGVPHAREPDVLLRDAVADWLRASGARLSAAQFVDPAKPRWTRTARAAAGCTTER